MIYYFTRVISFRLQSPSDSHYDLYFHGYLSIMGRYPLEFWHIASSCEETFHQLHNLAISTRIGKRIRRTIHPIPYLLDHNQLLQEQLFLDPRKTTQKPWACDLGKIIDKAKSSQKVMQLSLLLWWSLNSPIYKANGTTRLFTC